MKELESVDFSGDRESYDWETLLDGKAREMTSGEDYHCKDSTLATLARNSAKRIGKVVKTKKVDGGMVLQAFDASDEQKAAWEQQDAIKKQEKEAEKVEAAKTAGKPGEHKPEAPAHVPLHEAHPEPKPVHKEEPAPAVKPVVGKKGKK